MNPYSMARQGSVITPVVRDSWRPSLPQRPDPQPFPDCKTIDSEAGEENFEKGSVGDDGNEVVHEQRKRRAGQSTGANRIQPLETGARGTSEMRYKETRKSDIDNSCTIFSVQTGDRNAEGPDGMSENWILDEIPTSDNESSTRTPRPGNENLVQCYSESKEFVGVSSTTTNDVIAKSAADSTKLGQHAMTQPGHVIQNGVKTRNNKEGRNKKFLAKIQTYTI